MGPETYRYIEGAAMCSQDLNATGNNVCMRMPIKFANSWSGGIQNLKAMNNYFEILAKPLPDHTVMKPGETFKTQLNYTVTVYLLKKNHGDIFSEGDVEKVLGSDNATQTIECMQVNCRQFWIARQRVLQPGDYFITVQFNFTDEIRSVVEAMDFDGRTLNPDYAILSLGVKTLLFIGSMINCCFFFYNTGKLKKIANSLVFEQKCLRFINIFMVFFFDPFSILHSFYPSTFT